jgi:hypothetical protein
MSEKLYRRKNCPLSEKVNFPQSWRPCPTHPQASIAAAEDKSSRKKPHKDAFVLKYRKAALARSFESQPKSCAWYITTDYL